MKAYSNIFRVVPYQGQGPGMKLTFTFSIISHIERIDFVQILHITLTSIKMHIQTFLELYLIKGRVHGRIFILRFSIKSNI